MPYSISPDNCDDRHQHENCTPSSAPNSLDNSVPSQNDVSKHIQSLQARLNFARFKMKQGWENSTLLDVEQLWKQKQQKLIDELPKPRFTQRDIIDKRVYIPSPGARHARTKKAKLVRTYSSPSSQQRQYQQDDNFHQFSRNQSDHVSGESSNRINTTKSQMYFHHYNIQHSSQQRPKSQMMDCNQSASSSSDGEHNNKYDERYSTITTAPVRNSLDFLSYAIAMTEEAARDEVEQTPNITSSQPLPDISKMEPNLMEFSEHVEKSACAKRKLKAREDVSELNVSSSIAAATAARDTTDDSTSSPSSTVFTAAKTIMMFADSQPPQSSPPAHSTKSTLYPQH